MRVQGLWIRVQGACNFGARAQADARGSSGQDVEERGLAAPTCPCTQSRRVSPQPPTRGAINHLHCDQSSPRATALGNLETHVGTHGSDASHTRRNSGPNTGGRSKEVARRPTRATPGVWNGASSPARAAAGPSASVCPRCNTPAAHSVTLIQLQRGKDGDR